MGGAHELKVLEILLSGVSGPEKIKQLEKQNLNVIPEMRKLVTECPHSEQLVKRFERLKKGEVEEQPAEPPPPKADGQSKPAQGAAQAGQVSQRIAVTYVWLGGGLAVVAVAIALVAWRLRKK